MNSQLMSDEGITFSSFTQQSEEQDGPSFLNSQSRLFERAGIIDRTARETIEELRQIWINERNAPELLPYEHSIVEPLIESLESQAEIIMENMESNVDNKFESMVYQIEIERIKYLIRNYLRTRLFKIEKYTLYLLRQPNLQELLSSQEVIYARRYQELVEQHNFDSFLLQLPRSQHKQDEISVDMNMVIEPNLDAPVFCRVLASDIGHVLLDTDEILFEKGDIYILKYRDVRQYLRDKKVELI